MMFELARERGGAERKAGHDLRPRSYVKGDGADGEASRRALMVVCTFGRYRVSLVGSANAAYPRHRRTSPSGFSRRLVLLVRGILLLDPVARLYLTLPYLTLPGLADTCLSCQKYNDIGLSDPI